ncbi:MAG: hypothetical protein QOD81_2590 [Solirubrobacteraceae bacterium]|nr:hypothetical protein [Solirubrobacteraceae bacterium]
MRERPDGQRVDDRAGPDRPAEGGAEDEDGHLDAGAHGAQREPAGRLREAARDAGMVTAVDGAGSWLTLPDAAGPAAPPATPAPTAPAWHVAVDVGSRRAGAPPPVVGAVAGRRDRGRRARRRDRRVVLVGLIAALGVLVAGAVLATGVALVVGILGGPAAGRPEPG